MGRELRLILAAAGLAACVYFATWPFGANARDNDFLHFYAGARLSGSPVTLYSVEEARGVMVSVQPGAVFRPVVRPPFYYSMIRFLGWLPYPGALAVWQILSLCCLAAFAFLWEPVGLSSFVLLGLFVPVWYGLALGQDATFFLFAAALAAFLVRGGRPVAAGFVLSLLAAKPHVFLLVGVVGLCYGLRFLCGFLAGGAVLYGVSAAVMSDWLWPLAYLEYLNSPTGGNIVCRCEIDRRMLIAAAIAAAALYAWLWRLRPAFPAALAVALTASLLVAQRPFFYDAASLLPLAILLLPRQRAWAPLLLIGGAIVAWHWAGWTAARWAVAALLVYAVLVISREPSRRPVSVY